MTSTKTRVQDGESLSVETTSTVSTPLSDVKAALSSKYEIVENLGKGEVCTVYRAIDRRSNIEIALEILPPNLAQNEEYANRFHREAGIASRLNNRNISKVYEEGVHNGVHFVTVEYLDGLDLHTMIMWKGRLDVKESVKIIVPTVEALAYAHEKGLIHRDIRSSNIIITDVGRPVLTDFWVDHSFRGAKLSGAMEYMSPEQAEGKELTRSSNIYCFGIILYEALTGKVPFSGSNPFEIVGKIISSPPVFPRKIASTIPEWMEEIVLRCLEKNPRNRFSSAAELAASLLRSKSSAPVIVSQPVSQKSVVSHPSSKTKTKQPKAKKKTPPIAPRKPSISSKLFREDKKKIRVKAEKVEILSPPEKKIEKPVEEVKKEPSKPVQIKPLVRIAIPLVIIAAVLVVLISSPSILRRGGQDQNQTVNDETKSENTIINPTQQTEKTGSKDLKVATNEPVNGTPASKVEPIPVVVKSEARQNTPTAPEASSPKTSTEGTEKVAVTLPSKTVSPVIKLVPPEKVVPKIPVINIQWVNVDSGSFQMGSNSYPSTKPVHSVKVSRFYMSATEITFEQYDKFCELTNSKKPDDNGWGRGKMPVINISWNDAVAFCRWVSDQTGKAVRLPTEAEFEFAARGGNRSGSYAYSGNNDANLVAWYADNSGGKPHVVGTKLPNELGLYDLSGNVWEWCEDWYHQSYDGAPPDGKMWNVQDRFNPYRVLRGGSANGANYCSQVSFRFWLAPFYRDKAIGFRVVEEAK